MAKPLFDKLALPLFEVHSHKDPFLPNKFTPFDLNEEDLLEAAIKYITGAIFSASAPAGDPNHPLVKAINRWRMEDRFSNEQEIKEALDTLISPMVTQVYNQSLEEYDNWQNFLTHHRITRFFESINNPQLWQTEGQQYSAIAIKIKCADDSFMEQCKPLIYQTKPAQTIDMMQCVKLLMGEIRELKIDPESILLTQNSKLRFTSPIFKT